MQKFFQILGSFLLGLFQGSRSAPLAYEKLIDGVFARFEKIMSKAALGLSGVLLVMSGFLATYFNLLNQYDQTGSITMGAVAIGGVVLVLLGSILISVSARRLVSERVAKPQAQAQAQASGEASAPSTLEQALAVLVMDYIEERKKARQLKEDRERKKDQFDSTPHFSQDGEEFTVQ